MKAVKEIGVVYLARGADVDWHASANAFVHSYRRHAAGLPHDLHVVFKGFATRSELDRARQLFDGLLYSALELDDAGFDIGAYIQCATHLQNDMLCAFGTASELRADGWLHKLHANLLLPDTAMVGATGSYESLESMSPEFPSFPNVHLRSNAFLIRRELFLSVTEGVEIGDKMAAYHFESGAHSLTRRLAALGKHVKVVGRNGRGYSPKFWPASDTFRQGRQGNLLVADNQTRNFAALPWQDKQAFAFRTWGSYLGGLELCNA